MLTLGLWSCAGPEPAKRAQSDEDCADRYEDPELVTDYSVPDEHGWSGVVEFHPDWGDTCVLSGSPAEWCRAYLPCWDAPDCPEFEEFIEVIGWLDDDAEYLFTTGTVELYNPSYVFECETGDRLSFHVQGFTSAPFTVYFSSATHEVVSIARFDPDEFRCVGGSAPNVWWGTPWVLDGEECSQHSRGDYYPLAASVVFDSGAGEAESTSGCGCALPAARGPSWSWSLCLVVAWAGGEPLDVLPAALAVPGLGQAASVARARALLGCPTCSCSPRWAAAPRTRATSAPALGRSTRPWTPSARSRRR